MSEFEDGILPYMRDEYGSFNDPAVGLPESVDELTGEANPREYSPYLVINHDAGTSELELLIPGISFDSHEMLVSDDDPDMTLPRGRYAYGLNELGQVRRELKPKPIGDSNV